MIEFFIFGFFLTILQYNRYINTSFNVSKPTDNSCSPLVGMNKVFNEDTYKFNRYDFLTVPFYIVFFSLFYMMVVFYGINLVDFLLQSFGKTEVNGFKLLSRYTSSNQYYQRLLSSPNISLYFLRYLLVVVLFCVLLVHVIIIIRTGIYEDKKETVKRDFIGFTLVLGIVMGFAILFI